MEDKNRINFRLVQIKTEQFALFEENHSDKGKINLNTNLTFGLNAEDKLFLVTTKFTFELKKKPFMSIQASCFFQIEESAWENFTMKGKIVFPKKFVAHMSMIAVGTTRGILHSKTDKTIFNQYILPTINVAEIVSDDVIFE